jgi:hypothetical protein
VERESYKAKSGRTLYRPVVEETELRHSLFADNLGFCLECGAETDGVEPDARKYRCDDCGMPMVYGLEELLMMGLVRIGEVSPC